MFCNQCGVKLSDSVNFCSSCGAKVNGDIHSQGDNEKEETDDEDVDSRIDRIAVEGDYQRAIQLCTEYIAEGRSYIKEGSETGNKEECGYGWYCVDLGLIARAKLYFLLNNYNGAYNDIKEAYRSDPEVIFKDIDAFLHFDAPSLRKVCKKLEKEGYDFSFDIDDIEKC
jgi:hypothetical protein